MKPHRQPLVYLLMTLPGVLFLLVAFIAPVVVMLSSSFLTQTSQGIDLPITFSNYWRVIDTPLYGHVIWITLRISLYTTLLALFVGFPIAMVIARGGPFYSRLAIIIVVAPLVVSVVIRTYGWSLLLANNKSGVLNWTLAHLGFGPIATHLMYTETAVVLGSLHVFLPMMVLPLSSAIARVNPAVEEAAGTLGANGWRLLWYIMLPLCKPGILAGASVVFSLTAASFVTPAILGGSYALMLGNLVEQQILAVYDWPFGSALAVVMVLLIYGVNGLAGWAFDSKHLPRASRGLALRRAPRLRGSLS
ncbi:ABC transporter permease [Pseudomonas typographi]|uniref:ABC transporter permease n=1 Tax=Pseudomonas typographi TaxID=2715964 RepID=A0ABR7Z4R7_9PSED|nr:ABC transporter permease [Pseudomonas typographi]MBD1553047.1 ABC transporter permease [Pseudomonas typographi]MBD1588426.1 ABC transporter permease [Pseudomonas typographi]MBD1600499.1 ABC transporter permease [Pseudomonas typographi]